MFGPVLTARVAPALDVFCAAGADAVVRSLVVRAFDGSDRCLDAERESADFAVVDAILVAGEAADLCHVKTPDACLEGHPMRPRWQSIRRLMGAAHRQAGAVAEDGPKPSSLYREEPARRGQKVREEEIRVGKGGGST